MPLTDSLMSHWSLDETGGTRLDSTANNHDLADNNTVLYESGKVGRSALFDASASESLSVTNHSDLQLNGTSYTIMWRARVADLASACLVAKRSGTGTLHEAGNEYTVSFIQSSSGGYWRLSAGTDTQRSVGSPLGFIDYSTTDGQFDSGADGGYIFTGHGPSQEYYFGCAVYDSSIPNPNPDGSEANIMMYSEWEPGPGMQSHYAHGTAASGAWSPGRRLNSLNTRLESAPGAGSNALRFGTSTGAANFLEGGLDEVAIWKRALTMGEVEQLWNFGFGIQYPWVEANGSDLDWKSTGSLETLHRRHLTPERTNPVFVQYDYSWSGFLNDKFLDVPDVTDWASPPEVPVLPLEHRRAPYRFYSQEDRNIYPDVSDWWLQASEPVMPRKGAGEKAYWAYGMDRDSASGDPSVPTTNPSVASPSAVTGGGDDTVVPPTAEPSIDGKGGLYIPERADQEDTLRPRVDDPE